MSGRTGMRTFLIVWSGQLVSSVGSAMTGFAVSIFVFQQNGSVTELAFSLLAFNLPGVLLAPVAGVYVDRLDRRMVMLVSDTVAAVSSLALAVLFLTDTLQYWHVLVALVVASAAGTFQDPAYRAALPTLVAKERLGRVNGLVELGPAVGTLLAPAIAGALLLLVGLEAVLLVDFVTFLAAVGTLASVRFPRPAREDVGEVPSIRREALDGFRYLSVRRGLLGLLFVYAGANFVLTFSNVLFIPVFLSFSNEAALGTVMSIVGASMVIGSLIQSAWGGPQRRVRGILGLMALGGVFLAGVGLRPDLVFATTSAVGLMVFVPVVNGTSQALWQTKVEPSMQGRVFSTRRMVAQIATPVAYVLSGPVADNLFEPLLADGGPLAPTLGPVWGVGPGRGTAFLISVLGLLLVLLSVAGWLAPRVRNLEVEIPDAIPDEAHDLTRSTEAQDI